MTSSEPEIQPLLDRLVDVRRRRRWTQEEMAHQLGLTGEAYRALEKGRTIRLEWQTILRLMDVLDECGLSVAWFFGRTEPGGGSGGAGGGGSGGGGGGGAGGGGAGMAGVSNSRRTAEREDLPGAGESTDRMRLALDQAAAKLLSEEAARPPAPAVAFPPIPPARRGRPRKYVSDTGRPISGPRLPAADDSRESPGLIPTNQIRRLDPYAPDNAVGVPIRGRSLPPEYADGDVLVCIPGRPEPDQPGILLLTGGKTILGVFRPEPSGRIRINPLDADEPVRTVGPEVILRFLVIVRRIPRAQVSGPHV